MEEDRIFEADDKNVSLEKQEKQLKENFEKFYEKFRLDESLTFKDLAWLFYQQGHKDTTPQGVDLDYEVFADSYQRDAFIKFVEECLEHPSSTTEASNNDYALVSYKCPGHDKCLAWPDRCEDIGGDGEICTTLINLSKLCGVQKTENSFAPKVDPKMMLTPDEVETLSEIIARYNK